MVTVQGLPSVRPDGATVAETTWRQPEWLGRRKAWRVLAGVMGVLVEGPAIMNRNYNSGKNYF
jgi:hypothetical protein